MRKRLIGGAATLLASAGLIAAQSPTRAPEMMTNSGIHEQKAMVAKQTDESGIVTQAMDGDWLPTSGSDDSAPRTASPRPTAPSDKAESVPSMPTPRPMAGSATGCDAPAVMREGAGDCCATAAVGGHCWVNIDYLLWWTRDRDLPPLVTTGNPAFQGILGFPGTQILYGGPFGPEENGRSGIRFMAGTWLDCDQCCGIEVGAFWLPDRDDTRVFGSDMCSFLARPFFNLNDCVEASEITSLDGLARGSTTIRTPLEFWGAEINGIHKLCCGCAYRVDFLAGVRYLYLDESVEINEYIRVENELPPEFSAFERFAGATILVNDRFATRNQFYGGQIGLDGVIARGAWQFAARGKLGLGVTRQSIDITGSQTINYRDGFQENFTGGLLALPTNIGRYNNNEFTVIPEVNLNVGYRLTDCVLVYAGYSFLYWSRVVRPGDQIDRVVDVTQIPNFAPPGTQPTGIPRPGVPFAQTDFWAQGLNVGVELSW
jgi:hypothetical protein